MIEIKKYHTIVVEIDENLEISKYQHLELIRIVEEKIKEFENE